MIPRGPGGKDVESILRYLVLVADAINTPDKVFYGTLRANQTTSTFKHPDILPLSVVIPLALTANARTADGLGISQAVSQGQVVFTHASNAAVDQDFAFVISTAARMDERTAT